MSSHRITLWLGVAAMAMAMVGCSGESDSPAAARILSFQSLPAEIEAGRSATLAWETAEAVRVEISEVGGEQVALGDASASRGTVLVSPSTTTQYELRAYGKGRGVASQLTTVQVIPALPMPAIVSFVADPQQVTLGDEVTLSWVTSAADSLRIVDAVGRPVVLEKGEAASEGQIKLTPRGSTSYHLSATGPGGRADAEVAVQVHGLPSITLKAPVEPIEPGGTATLRWSAAEATKVTITSEDGTVVYDGTDLEGEVGVQAAESTVYIAVAKGPTAEGTARATVGVRPVIDSFEVVTQTPVYPGDPIEIRWSVRGAKELTVERLGLDPWQVPVEALQEGETTLPVGSDGSFRLRARSGSLFSEAVAQATLQMVPRIHEMSVTPDLVSASEGHPATVTITWLVDGATELRLERGDGEHINLRGHSPRGDSIEVEVTGPTSFRLTAVNSHGASVAQRQVMAHGVPTIDRFVAMPSVASVGEEIELFWETTDATEVIVEKVGGGVVGENLPVDGSIRDEVLAESSWVLKAYNALGHETVSEPVTVTIGAPAIVEFVADRFFVRPGLPVVLSWSNVGGQELLLTDGAGTPVVDVDGQSCSTTDLFRIASGTCVIPGPAVGEHTYTLTLRNGLTPPTEVTAQVAMESVAGPVITSFEIEGSPATVGVPVSLRWQTTEDAAGNGALIELTTDGEVFHTTSTPAFSGTLDYAFPRAGVQQVVLRAHSAEGEHRATRTVDIRGEAIIDTFEATPSKLDTADGPLVTTLSWTFQNGWTAKIHEVAADGTLVEPALYDVGGEGRDATGTTTHEVTAGIHTLALVVDNQAGSIVRREVTVSADIVEATIVAGATDVVEGANTVELTWETRNATHAHITPVVMTDANRSVVREIDDPFFDIRQMAGATALAASNQDSGVVDVEFPEGFTFPWDGQEWTSARVWVDGVLSFNKSTSSYSNNRLPTTSYQNVHLAIFWMDLHLKRNTAAPEGELHSLASADEKGPFVAIQWSGVHPYATGALPASFNFQIVLRPDGSFEYRYGDMTSTDATSGGTTSTVGFQNFAGTVGHTLNHKEAFAGGFAHRSWVFEPQTLELSGSMEVPVVANTDFKVWARNAYSQATDSVHVRYWSKPNGTLTVASTEAEIDKEFNLQWTATRATRVDVIARADGTVLCTTSSPDGTPGSLSGSCATTESVVGSYVYAIRVVNGLETNAIEKEITVKVYRPFQLVAFHGDTEAIFPGESVELSWDTIGAAFWTLKAGTEEIAIPQVGTGTFTVQPSFTTTYQLVIKDEPGADLPQRERTASFRVVVRTNTLDEAHVSRTQFPAGSGPQTVTVTWDTTNATGVKIPGVTLFEAFDEPRFVDISETGETRTRTSGSATSGRWVIDVPEDFHFEFDGQRATKLTATTEGILWIGETTSTSSFNARIPSTSYTNSVHLAPFWDDLTTHEIYTARGTDEIGNYFIVQWLAQIPAATTQRMNFQVVLYENGWFEYRYGTMEGHQVGRADGSSATIGFQNRTGTNGLLTSYDTAWPGGLTGRTFRYKPTLPASGSVEVVVTEGSGDLVLCSFDAHHEECRTFPVTFVKAADLLFTELMVLPVGGSEGQWVEIRNVSSSTIELQGMILENSWGGSHTIADSIRLGPGEFAVLSRGDEATNGGIGADTVYGSGITLSAETDTIFLKFGGATIDSVAWNPDWSLVEGKSLSLDGAFHVQEAANGDRARWCNATEEMVGGSFGSPGFAGKGCHTAGYTADWFSDRPFLDIARTGAPVPKLVAADNYMGAAEGQPIGFAFPFFDGHVTEWWGSSNGFLSFAALTGHFHTPPTTMPAAAAPNGVIAPLWMDLNAQSQADLSSAQTELLLVDGQQVRVVQWTNVRQYLKVSNITFQVQLWENGDIVIAYKDISAGNATDLASIKGGAAAIGIENLDGSAGIPFAIKKPWLHEGRVLAFEKN